MDKMDHYIKRAIGLPGEDLEIKEGTVYTTGQENEPPRETRFTHRVTSNAGSVNEKSLDRIGVDIRDHPQFDQGYYNLSNDEVEAIQNLGSGLEVHCIKPHDMDN